MDCLFCKIINAEIPSNKVYDDDKVFAFYDIDPQAPVHILILPKIHVASANEINQDNSDIIAHIFTVIPKIAKELKLEKGYRVITNIGDDGGQTVHHLHFHLLGGRKLEGLAG